MIFHQIPWDFANDQPAESLNDHLSNYPAKIQQARSGRPTFVDLGLLDPADRMANGDHPVKWLFEAAALEGMRLIPVTGLDRDADYQQAVRQAAARDHRGICLRLTEEDLDRPNLPGDITQLLADVALWHDQVDLLLDLANNPPASITVAALLVSNSIPNIANWRNFILASCAFPQNFVGIQPMTIRRVDRDEWLIWVGLYGRRATLPRMPNFADYAVANPDVEEIDPRIVRQSAQIRYTVLDAYLLVKGRAIRSAGAGQRQQICQLLVAHPEFFGTSHCQPDAYIVQCAQGQAGPGNPTTWRCVATHHHLTVVTSQLASQPVP